MSKEASVEPKRDLTDFTDDGDQLLNLAAVLDEVGLELWQAPEGFWTIRVKPAKAAPSSPSTPHRRRGTR
jgi:hypothetical protein